MAEGAKTVIWHAVYRGEGLYLSDSLRDPKATHPALLKDTAPLLYIALPYSAAYIWPLQPLPCMLPVDWLFFSSGYQGEKRETNDSVNASTTSTFSPAATCGTPANPMLEIGRSLYCNVLSVQPKSRARLTEIHKVHQNKCEWAAKLALYIYKNIVYLKRPFCVGKSRSH
jgi:hypothetical protein